MAEKRKSFAAQTAGEARGAASGWLRDFEAHGPLEIRSIRVSMERDLFVAIVSYTEMEVEETPQYFADYHPVARTA
jgi:hypothetical protein